MKPPWATAKTAKGKTAKLELCWARKVYKGEGQRAKELTEDVAGDWLLVAGKTTNHQKPATNHQKRLFPFTIVNSNLDGLFASN
jgi:hypothetical protein